MDTRSEKDIYAELKETQARYYEQTLHSIHREAESHREARKHVEKQLEMTQARCREHDVQMAKYQFALQLLDGMELSDVARRVVNQVLNKKIEKED